MNVEPACVKVVENPGKPVVTTEVIVEAGSVKVVGTGTLTLMVVGTGRSMVVGTGISEV